MCRGDGGSEAAKSSCRTPGAAGLARVRWSSALRPANGHAVADVERHEVLAQFKRPIVAVPGLGHDIVKRRLGLGEYATSFARRDVVRDDALDVGVLH